MSKTRNNHYVPQWYQERFFEPGKNTLTLLDLNPNKISLEDGREFTHNAKFNNAPTSRCFVQRDLYSTFFGTSINDEIERKLFGAIDTNGSRAIPAFCDGDAAEWQRHFQTLFEFIDVQKIRTPKGLAWLRDQYPDLTQNELMYEMQGIRMIHCTIWAEGVREIVSAESSGIKFIISDHPVTVYNHALSPGNPVNNFPGDPAIELKASQTIFPLSQDFCLILTNLEYAEDPTVNPSEKRTFARNFGHSMVRTDTFIKERQLSDAEVAQVNHVIKSRAHRYIAAGRDEWLYPEKIVNVTWSDLRETLLPKGGLWQFGGEMYAGYDDGRVYYQDAFGRTENPREILLKNPERAKLRAGDLCGCGSGRRFDQCCLGTPKQLRPSWSELSIRERNMTLLRGISHVLDLNSGKDWTSVRRDLTDDQISQVYSLYEALWPLETDLLQLLPKPDGRPRAIYSGHIHPSTIGEFIISAPLYFGELIVQTPFIHNGVVGNEYKPVNHPQNYRYEFLKTVVFFLRVMPFVEAGLIHLIPDPCDFNYHLRQQVMSMAESRANLLAGILGTEERAWELAQEDFKRTFLSLPPDVLKRKFKKNMPDASDQEIEELESCVRHLKERDPLAVLQEDTLVGGSDGGQMSQMKMAPNFEIAMYLAQATGAVIVTDSPVRWAELNYAMKLRSTDANIALRNLAYSIESAEFEFLVDVQEILALSQNAKISDCPKVFNGISKYLKNLRNGVSRPNVEDNLRARFVRAQDSAKTIIGKSKTDTVVGKLKCAFPVKGIRDNNVTRLLIMANSKHHLPSVPAAYFIQRVTN